MSNSISLSPVPVSHIQRLMSSETLPEEPGLAWNNGVDGSDEPQTLPQSRASKAAQKLMQAFATHFRAGIVIPEMNDSGLIEAAATTVSGEAEQDKPGAKKRRTQAGYNDTVAQKSRAEKTDSMGALLNFLSGSPDGHQFRSDLITGDALINADDFPGLAPVAEAINFYLMDMMFLAGDQDEPRMAATQRLDPPPASSDKQLIGHMKETIGKAESGYLEEFMKAFQLMQKWLDAWTDFNSDLADIVSMLNDRQVKIDITALRAAYNTMQTDFAGPPQLYPSEAGKTVTQEEAQAWIGKLGGGVLKEISPGKYVVCMDLTPLDKLGELIDVIEDGDDIAMMFEYDAFKAGLDGQTDRVKASLQMFTQKMTNAKSTFDRLIEILMSLIEQSASCANKCLTN